MENFTLFANGFVSYLVCFIVFVLTIVIAVFIGIAIRKNQNKKLVTESAEAEAVQDKEE